MSNSLTAPATMAQRISRDKTKVLDAGIPISIPGAADLADPRTWSAPKLSQRSSSKIRRLVLAGKFIDALNWLIANE